MTQSFNQLFRKGSRKGAEHAEIKLIVALFYVLSAFAYKNVGEGREQDAEALREKIA